MVNCLASVSMEERTESQRRPYGDSYLLNVVQIPLLRGFGSVILSFYVLLYDLLVSAPFSSSRYLEFVAALGVYCLVSWLILREAYKKPRWFDLSLFFLIVDL